VGFGSDNHPDFAIQPLNCVRSDPEMCGESGNCCPLSICPWGGVGAARTAKDSALANCVLKLTASVLASLASRVILSKSCPMLSSIPATRRVCRAISSSLRRVVNCVV